MPWKSPVLRACWLKGLSILRYWARYQWAGDWLQARSWYFLHKRDHPLRPHKALHWARFFWCLVQCWASAIEGCTLYLRLSCFLTILPLFWFMLTGNCVPWVRPQLLWVEMLVLQNLCNPKQLTYWPWYTWKGLRHCCTSPCSQGCMNLQVCSFAVWMKKCKLSLSFQCLGRAEFLSWDQVKESQGRKRLWSKSWKRYSWGKGNGN